MGYALTKEDISHLRVADDISVSYRPKETRVVVRKKNPKYGHAPFAERELEYVLPVLVTDYSGKASRCFESVPLWRYSTGSAAATAIDSLKVGDEVEFQFYPDHSTNAYAGNARLHVDALFLYVTRGKKRFEYLLEVSVCPDNSARMCQGVPFTDSMLRPISA
jgi:hypothetical protein